MALKSAHHEPERAEVIEEALDELDKTLDRLRVMYEQYFLGIQKQAPAFIHLDVERKIRDLTQLNIRNTGLRYRYNTLTQKFGSYNSYWRRTLRQIEQGKYVRSLSKLGRRAAETGEEIPEEILAAMPKLMRERVKRDREAALALAKRQNPNSSSDGDTFQHGGTEDDLLTLKDSTDDATAFVSEPSVLKRDLRSRSGALVLNENDDFDLDAFLSQAAAEEAAAPATPAAKPAPRPPAAQPSKPVQGIVAATRAGPVGPPPAIPQRTSGQLPPLPRAAPPPIPQRATGQIPALPRPTDPANPATPPVRPITPSPIVQPVARSPIVQPGARQTGPSPIVPPIQPSPIIQPGARQTGPSPIVQPGARQTGPSPIVQPGARETGPSPVVPAAARPPSIPSIPPPTPVRPAVPPRAPSQISRPNPISPGASTSRAIPPPIQAPAPAKPERTGVTPAPTMRPPPGMTDADVNTLYTKYVKAKEMVGEPTGPQTREKLLRTINAQAPKIMEQYKAAGVDFSIVVKDNQVIIRAKPKP